MISLSPREKQVLLLWLSGLKRRETALELGITLGAVSSYFQEIYRKLGVNGQLALRAWAEQHQEALL